MSLVTVTCHRPDTLDFIPSHEDHTKKPSYSHFTEKETASWNI